MRQARLHLLRQSHQALGIGHHPLQEDILQTAHKHRPHLLFQDQLDAEQLRGAFGKRTLVDFDPQGYFPSQIIVCSLINHIHRRPVEREIARR